MSERRSEPRTSPPAGGPATGLARTLLLPYRTRPGLLLALSAAVFVPLNIVRYPLVDARVFPLALGLTLAGHLLLAALLHRFHGRLALPVPLIRPVPLVVAGLLVVVGLEIGAGRLVELVAGTEAFGVTLGGFLPSVVIGPLFALLVREAWVARRRSSARGRDAS